MSTNYKIIGEDGKEYGPISAELLRQWIAEGRVESRTPVFVEGAKEWSFVGLLPEFAGHFSGSTSSTISPPVPARKTSGFATVGLICSILAWPFFCCCCGFPFNLFGLVFSLIGLSQINRRPELYEGRGQAVAGLVLAVLSLLLFMMYFLAVIWSMATGNFHVSFNNGWN